MTFFFLWPIAYLIDDIPIFSSFIFFFRVITDESYFYLYFRVCISTLNSIRNVSQNFVLEKLLVQSIIYR